MSIRNISNFSIENLREFVEKYLSQIIYFICFVLIVIFFVIFTSNRRESKENELMVNYYKAFNYLNSGNEDEAIKVLNDISNSKYATDDMKSISNLKMANLLSSKGKIDEAANIYLKVFFEENNDLFLRDLSGLNALVLLVNKNNTADYQIIEDLIIKLSNPNNPLLVLVNEQEGIFKIQQGKVEDGLEILRNVLKQDLDENTEKRIKSILSLYESI
ncbi:MAG TPA: hypothetical protein VLL98_05780 [Rickettsiales bacterium]|nr:hypothetical protein [Rickettsiales bacterium]